MTMILRELIRALPERAISVLTHPNRNVHFIEALNQASFPLDENTIYFGEYSSALAGSLYRKSNFVLFSDLDPDTRHALPEDSNTLIVFKREDLMEMVHLAMQSQNRTARLQEINQELLMLIQNGSNLQKLLDYGSSVLHNPMMVVDISFGYVASSGTENLSREPNYNWQYTIENGIMPSDYIRRIMSTDVKYLDTDRDTPKIIETRVDNLNANHAYSIKIVHNQDIYGYIKVLAQDHEITPFEQELFLLISQYAGILSSTSIQKGTILSDPTETLLTSLLLSRIPEDKAVQALQSHFSLKLFKNIYLISIHFDINPDPVDFTFRAHKRLKTFFNKAIVCMIQSSFIILFDTSQDKSPFNEPKSEFYRSFIKLLEEINCHANISFVFHDLEDIIRYYRQTQFCEEYRFMMNDNSPVIRYSEIYEYQMITALRDRVDMKSLIHPAVHKLMITDNKFGSNLTETLFTYINHQSSIPATAAAMYLHYNTVKHRISKIVELTSFDSTDKDEIFRIMLSEKILELLDPSKAL